MRMAELVHDEILNTIAICGTPEQVCAQIISRFGDHFDSIALYTPYDVDPDHLRIVREGLQETHRS
jgi:hypothetical protein